MKIDSSGILFALDLSQGLFTLLVNQLASDSAAHYTWVFYQSVFVSVSSVEFFT